MTKKSIKKQTTDLPPPPPPPPKPPRRTKSLSRDHKYHLNEPVWVVTSVPSQTTNDHTNQYSCNTTSIGTSILNTAYDLPPPLGPQPPPTTRPPGPQPPAPPTPPPRRQQRTNSLPIKLKPDYIGPFWLATSAPPRTSIGRSILNGIETCLRLSGYGCCVIIGLLIIILAYLGYKLHTDLRQTAKDMLLLGAKALH